MFNFQQDEGSFQCKNCGVDIELWQYRRLALCPNCERPAIEAAKGGPEQQAQRVLDAHGQNWDREFLETLNKWNDERGGFVSPSNKRVCPDCGEKFIPNIMKAGGSVRCAICLQVDSIIEDNWDTSFLEKLNWRTNLE